MFRLARSFLKKFGRDERGAMMVEMTLITPLMLTLSAGVFEFANLFEKKLLIEAGLHDGARYVARCRPFNDATCLSRAANIAATATVDGSGVARVSGWTAGSVTVDPDYLTVAVTTDTNGNQNYGSSDPNVYTVRVSTSFTYTGTSLLSFLGLSPITLTGAEEERYIGW